MSFSDRPTLTAAQKLGCAAYGAFGVLLVCVGLVGAALRDCASAPDGTGCENDELFKFMLFPGSLILVVIGGVLLARHMMKDNN